MGLGITLVVVDKLDDASSINKMVINLGQIGFGTPLDDLRNYSRDCECEYDHAGFYRMPVLPDDDYYFLRDGYENGLVSVPLHKMIKILKNHEQATGSGKAFQAVKILEVIDNKGGFPVSDLSDEYKTVVIPYFN